MINELKEEIINGGLDEVIAKLYCGAKFADKQKERYINTLLRWMLYIWTEEI